MIEDRDPAYTKWVVATAYSSDRAQTDSTPCFPAMDFDMCAHYEETGLENTIATNFLPLGTKVRFPELYGDKVFVVRDRMNSRYNGTNRIDIWVGSKTPVNQEIIDTAKAKASPLVSNIFRWKCFKELGVHSSEFKEKPPQIGRGFDICKKRAGIEPANKGFGDPHLSTWLRYQYVFIP